MKHKCQFDLQITSATGYIEKQEGQQNIIACEGNIYKCKCGKRILVPYNQNLRIVEVE